MTSRLLAAALPLERVAITATEIAVTQVDAIYIFARGAKPHGGSHAGMNEATLPGLETRIMALPMAVWTWAQSLDLLVELASRGVSVESFSMIVNDLVLPPSLREGAQARLRHALPQALTQELERRGIEYIECTAVNPWPHLRLGRREVPFEFAFESHLRNRARKVIDSYLRHGTLLSQGGSVRVCVDVSRLVLRAASDFVVRDGDEITLERHGRTPLGPAFLLAHYMSHGAAASVNVADFMNKCAYRSGAVARHSLESGAPAVHNLLFYSDSTEDCVHEVFASDRSTAIAVRENA